LASLFLNRGAIRVKDNSHTLHAHQHHFGWNRANAPVRLIAPGDVVTFETVDSSGGQLNSGSKAADLAKLDFGRVNPVTGPVHVDGAAPGDALKVTLLGFEPSGWGWTGLIPGFGLLADQFPDPALHIWKYDGGTTAPLAFGSIARVPLRPFAGTLGLAPAEAGLHSVVPPRRVGGNMDFRDLTAGAELYLPVEVAGGLFSLGDTHAAQGDGEVCGTAIESPMVVTVKLELIKQADLAFPRAYLPPSSLRLDHAKGYDATTGIGPDLMTGARAAVSAMVDLLATRHGISPADAYMLCSVSGDLRISEIVDMPNWIVSFHMPRSIFA
jgi:acetamidase/formamidase